jgi:serine phosphatase RsbU (regulator of sigma subunit)
MLNTFKFNTFRRIYKVLSCVLFFNMLCLFAFAQTQSDKVVDSLYNQFTLSKSDTNKVSILNKITIHCLNANKNELALKYIQLSMTKNQEMLALQKNPKEQHFYKQMLANAYNSNGRLFMNTGDYRQALEQYNISLQLRQEINDDKGIANSFNNIAIVYNNQGNLEKALGYHQKALDVRQKMGDKFGIAMSFHNIGVINIARGDYEKALKNNLASLAIKEEIGDKAGMIMSLNNLGIIYEKQGDTIAALNNYMKYLKASEEAGSLLSMSYAYNNIGNIYMYKKEYKKAYEYQLNSLKIKEKMGDKAGMAMSYSNIGSILYEQNKTKEALDNYLQSLKLCKQIGDTVLMINLYHNISNLYLKKGDQKRAIENATIALQFAEKTGSKPGLKNVYSSFYEIYAAQGDYKKAFDYYQLFSDVKDSLLNEESSKQIAEMNVKYESEKKDKELLKKDAELNKQQVEGQRKKIQRNAFIVVFFLILVLAVFVFRSYRQKKQANLLLEDKNQLIEKQKQLVEDRNLKITDSITYAQRIQQATLPPEELIKEAFPESFILFLPKDIVSGDFYWYTELPMKMGHLMVVGDCTGHGVPGAFMSMIGNTLLNEIVNVKGIYTPVDILIELNKGVVGLLNQSTDDSGTQDDGMDVTIVAYNPSTNEIDYASANHISYLYTQNNLVQLQGDIYSIGGMFGRTDLVFSGQHLKLDKGDMLYLFTDGYADQFGGEKNTKLTTARFEKLLLEINKLDTETQKQQLLASFRNWKGDNKQLDDVLVMGIKI